MREIDFRAWDEGNNVMHYNFEFITSGDYSVENNDWIVFKSDKQRLEDGFVFDNPYFNLQLKKMQYTGLKDINGIKIFENDILKPNYVVAYSNKEARYFCHSVDALNRDFKDFRNLVVIGNIYENPELAKETNDFRRS